MVTGDAVASVTNVAITGSNSGQATVTAASPAALGIGTHTATITVTVCTSDINCTSGLIGTPQTVNVSYVVNGVVLPPAAAVNYVITQTSPDADYVKTLQFTASPPWSAASTFAALGITPSSGSTSSGALTLTLNRSIIDAMSNGVTSTTLVIGAAGGMQVSVPVSIDVRRTQLNYVAPHVIPANQAQQQLILRGFYLDAMAIGSVRFGTGAGAVSVPRASLTVDATSILVNGVPALPAGSYPVQLVDTNGNVIGKSTGTLVAVNTLGATARAVYYPDARTRRITDLIFDAEHSTLAVGVQYPATGESASEILLYPYISSTWQAPQWRPMAYLSSLALKPDGSGWMATAQYGGADNLVQFCTPDFINCGSGPLVPATTQRWTQIGMTNDGDPIVLTTPKPIPAEGGAVSRYSIAQNQIRSLGAPLTYDGILAASDDGRWVLIGSRGTAAGGVAQPLYRFNALTGTFATLSTAPLPLQVTSLALDGRGTLALINRTLVYDTVTTTQLGSLPATTLCSILSRDSTRAYTFDSDLKVHVFDLTATPVLGQYPEIGSGITADDPGAGTNGQDMRMAISPDAKTLFLAGGTQIVVVPLP